ncbi:MAG: 2-amino-4-hydroxy-6-hydroxymethyldihydropteridine diphosphokinase, partial [Mycobacterium sp.]
GVDQGRFLNAVLIVDDPACDGHGWLRRGHELEQAADRVRGERWGPRTLDVDVISCHRATSQQEGLSGETEVLSRDSGLTLPHPLAHLRAFVMVPWLTVEPDARLTVIGSGRPVAELLAELEPAARTDMRLTDLVLHRREQPDRVLES